MKRNLLFFIVLFLFSGCFYTKMEQEYYNIIEQNNFELDNYKIEVIWEVYNVMKVYGLFFRDYGLIGHQIGYKIDGFTKDTIKINKYVMKKNNEEIKILEPLVFETYGNMGAGRSFYPGKFKTLSKRFYLEKLKKTDIIEVIFDLSIKIKDKVINKVISAKYKQKDF